MAHVNGECSILLADGSPCRRAASYACEQFHCVCPSHRMHCDGTLSDTCPLCSGEFVAYSPLEFIPVTGGRRQYDGIFHAVGGFFHDAAVRWLPELQGEGELGARGNSDDEF